MNKEEITKEDILNVTGSMFDTMFDYVENSNDEIEQLQQENKQLKEEIKAYQDMYFDKVMVINKAIEHIELYTNRFLNDDVSITQIEMRYLLKILRGEENEN